MVSSLSDLVRLVFDSLAGKMIAATSKNLGQCSLCGANLGRLKATTTKELTFDEAEKVVELFRAGNLETMKKALAWPAAKNIGGGKQWRHVSFNLIGCLTCNAEVIDATVAAFNRNEWQAYWTARRDVPVGISLRDQFV
jgi:hypothetical protein